MQNEPHELNKFEANAQERDDKQARGAYEDGKRNEASYKATNALELERTRDQDEGMAYS